MSRSNKRALMVVVVLVLAAVALRWLGGGWLDGLLPAIHGH
jgi:hypothetical protein